jgi:hypothetical protein
MIIEELRKSTIISVIASAVLSICLLFIDYRYSLSIMLGNFVSIIYLVLLQNGVTDILHLQIKNKFRIYVGFFLNLIVLGIPFYLAAIFPSVFSFVAGAIGLMMNKIVIYILAMTEGG